MVSRSALSTIGRVDRARIFDRYTSRSTWATEDIKRNYKSKSIHLIKRILYCVRAALGVAKADSAELL